MSTPLHKRWLSRFLKKYNTGGYFHEGDVTLNPNKDFYEFPKTKKERITDLKTLMDKYEVYIPYIDLGRENRFRTIDHPFELRDSVRKELSQILRMNETKKVKIKAPREGSGIAQFFKESFAFGTTTIAIFMVLLLATNVQAYSQVATYWWDTVSGENEHVTQNLEKLAKVDENAKETKNLPLSLDATHASADNKTGSGSGQILDVTIPVYPPDNRIVIPKIGQNIPIQEIAPDNLIREDWQALEDDIQKGLQKGVVHYPGTAVPGQIGNVFITGHSSYYVWAPGEYKDTFALLHNLEIGDTIIIYYNENKYTYVIEERKVVKPNQVDVLKQSDDRRLTLMTCTPIGTALNRLILVAKQI
ncbi:MAG: sortase [Candidatus Gracilibacteria bacterium]